VPLPDKCIIGASMSSARLGPHVAQVMRRALDVVGMRQEPCHSRVMSSEGEAT
jgi:hypothetical protein